MSGRTATSPNTGIQASLSVFVATDRRGPCANSLISRAPERLPLKNGRTARIEYDEKQAPSVSVVLQQLYDVNENPKVAGGRITVVVHLLSPAQRPIQTTGDLGRFWKESYPAVKAQLRGRYPKHEWR